MAEKVKMTVNVLKDDLEELQKLAEKNGTTVTEELRKALALTRLANEVEGDGGKVLLEDKKGNLRQLVKL
jgi:hypothetical protein